MKLTLPVPPSSNRYWRHAGPRVNRSAEAVNYIGAVSLLLMKQKVKPIRGEVSIAVEWHRKAKRGDLDNILKILFDALKDRAFGDDSAIRRIVAERFEDHHNPRMEVTIQPYEVSDG